MTKIRIHSQLHYTITQPSSLTFAVLAAHSRHQTVLDETLRTEPEVVVPRLALGPGLHELIRLSLEPGPFSLTYDATVQLAAHTTEDPPAAEVQFGDVPIEALPFLNPSRYCESDKLGRFAYRTFGGIEPGFERVAGICNWIYDHMEYVGGSTDSSTTAIDVLVGGAGVCRDYAHLGITFCRALGIPARYVSGYAVGLEPPDFHGFFEAYLDHTWFLFDATRMAPVDGLVRIAAGRDAADVAFATLVGAATLDQKVVSALFDDARSPDHDAPPAVTTA
ncbi:MAG TPA: transglutaminase family protein [Acidimicrobiales bacterium]